MNQLNTETQAQAVKRLLRRNGSSEFFKEDGWTNNPDEAKTYCDVLEAADACARHRLSNMELALRIEPRACDLFCTPIC